MHVDGFPSLATTFHNMHHVGVIRVEPIHQEFAFLRFEHHPPKPSEREVEEFLSALTSQPPSKPSVYCVGIPLIDRSFDSLLDAGKLQRELPLDGFATTYWHTGEPIIRQSFIARMPAYDPITLLSSATKYRFLITKIQPDNFSSMLDPLLSILHFYVISGSGICAWPSIPRPFLNIILGTGSFVLALETWSGQDHANTILWSTSRVLQSNNRPSHATNRRTSGTASFRPSRYSYCRGYIYLTPPHNQVLLSHLVPA